MSNRQYYGKEEEKTEKGEMTWDEKWRRDPLSGVVWALILVWAGLVLLADNLGLFARLEWFSAWGFIFTGAGLIVLLEAVVRLLVPAYRRPVGGTLIWGGILVAIGVGNMFDIAVAWPLILIAIGVGLLLRGLLRGI